MYYRQRCKVISLFLENADSIPLLEVSFRDSMDFWSFLQQLAEGRIAAEKRVEDEGARQDALFAKIIETFPAGAMGGEPFSPPLSRVEFDVVV